MGKPTEQTAREILEVVAKANKWGKAGFGPIEVMTLLLAGVWRDGVMEGGGQEAVDRVEGRHADA